MEIRENLRVGRKLRDSLTQQPHDSGKRAGWGRPAADGAVT